MNSGYICERLEKNGVSGVMGINKVNFSGSIPQHALSPIFDYNFDEVLMGLNCDTNVSI